MIEEKNLEKLNRDIESIKKLELMSDEKKEQLIKSLKEDFDEEKKEDFDSILYKGKDQKVDFNKIDNNNSDGEDFSELRVNTDDFDDSKMKIHGTNIDVSFKNKGGIWEINEDLFYDDPLFGRVNIKGTQFFPEDASWGNDCLSYKDLDEMIEKSEGENFEEKFNNFRKKNNIVFVGSIRCGSLKGDIVPSLCDIGSELMIQKRNYNFKIDKKGLSRGGYNINPEFSTVVLKKKNK